MEKKAFEKGIVKISIPGVITYDEAIRVSNEKAGGQATREEFIESGVHAGDFVPQAMFVRRNDGHKDAIIIGNFAAFNTERYISLYDDMYPIEWENDAVEPCRPIDWIYAKRDYEKNKEFKTY